MNQDRTEAWVLQGLRYMFNHQTRPPQTLIPHIDTTQIPNNDKAKMAQIRDRLNLNLNDPHVLRKRKHVARKFFNINLLRLTNIQHNQEQRRLCRLGLTWDLSMNPLSEDFVNPFSEDEFPINGEYGLYFSVELQGVPNFSGLPYVDLQYPGTRLSYGQGKKECQQ